MFEGSVAALFIAPTAHIAMEPRDEVTVLDGLGIDGDRYAGGDGSFSSDKRSGRHVTLIESEAVAAVSAETGIALDASETRRNVVTSGVPLNHLVGRRFRVGEVVLEGKRLCEPCDSLEGATRPGVRMALLHRGGLRADIVSGGMVRLGDTIVPVDD